MISPGSQRQTLVDVLITRRAAGVSPDQAAPVAREAALLVGGVVALALSAHVIIPLPFTPVPVTGQTFAVLLLAAAYGMRRGLATVVAYLLAGVAGLPVFAAAPGAFSYGYLVGFVFAAIAVGWLAENGWGRSLPTAIGAMLIGEAAIYACGLPWLARFVGWDHVFALGVWPFIIGDALKLLAAALLLPAAWFATRRLLGEEPR